jgi:hypothetical protein
VTGPFSTEREARDAAIALAGGLDDGAVILSKDQRVQMLVGVAANAGIELGEYDLRILRWLANYEDATIGVIAGLITRASQQWR